MMDHEMTFDFDVMAGIGLITSNDIEMAVISFDLTSLNTEEYERRLIAFAAPDVDTLRTHIEYEHTRGLAEEGWNVDDSQLMASTLPRERWDELGYDGPNT